MHLFWGGGICSQVEGNVIVCKIYVYVHIARFAYENGNIIIIIIIIIIQ